MKKRRNVIMKSEFIMKLWVLFLCFGLLFVHSSDVLADGETGYVNYSYLNLRAKPNMTADVVIQLSRNDRVEILTDLGGWYEVNAYHGREVYYGYVAAQYISFISDESGNTEYDGYVDNSWMNLRSGPSTSTNVVVILSANDRLKILDYTNGWYHVIASHGGSQYEGYAYEAYVKTGLVSQPDVPNESERVAHVAYARLNLRVLPGTEHQIIVTLNQYEELSVLGETNGWYKVLAYHGNNTYEGYVASNYVQMGYPEVGSQMVGYVDSKTLNLRAQPGLDGSILIKLSRNDKVTLMDYNEGWYKVTAEHAGDSYVGYVTEQYISFEPVNPSGGSVGYVNYDWLNLRKQPSTDSDVVQVLSRNDRLDLLSHSTGWFKVIAYHDGNMYNGYVAEQYVGR